MLVLTRRVGESIIIGNGKGKITITLLTTKGDQSKIGIAAPDEIPIHREEIYQRIQRELNIQKKSVTVD